MGVLGEFVGRIFGSDKAIQGAVDGVTNGLDKLVYTKEEKADAAAVDRANARAMLIDWMDKTQGQNITRRALAIIIAFTWLSQYFITGLLNIAAIWITDIVTVEKVQLSAEVTANNANGMTGAMMLILGFYFAAPHLDKIIEPAMARFGNSVKGPTTNTTRVTINE